MRFAVGPLLALPLLCRASAINARAAEHAAATTTSFPGPWVTIDPSGHVSTVTPTLSGKSTVSAPPSALTQHTAYILSLNGHAMTTTAAPPVASATGPGTGTAGAFMQCNSKLGVDQGTTNSFCQPRPGTQLSPNHTYYIVWDPSGFAANQTVVLSGTYGGAGAEAGGEKGFATEPLLASSGFYAWTIASDFVFSQTASTSGRVNTTFSLLYNASSIPNAAQEQRIDGPSVLVTTAAEVPVHHRHRHHVTAVAIAVPVVIGAAVLALLSYCVWAFRHHGHLPCIGGLVSRRTSSFSAKGYGTRQSYGQRIGGGGRSVGTYGAGVGVGVGGGGEAFDTNSSETSARGRGNVFRDELRRQEEERRV
ncbi:hypothetical protein SCUCBS95973_005964 [Sporothrix curviconia]|uniref:Uncharacterized protein n=1 Tax=Sporothrix curviconia TaxID=1260050 RepID=A0ABP0C259_9PEZI